MDPMFAKRVLFILWLFTLIAYNGPEGNSGTLAEIPLLFKFTSGQDYQLRKRSMSSDDRGELVLSCNFIDILTCQTHHKDHNFTITNKSEIHLKVYLRNLWNTNECIKYVWYPVPYYEHGTFTEIYVCPSFCKKCLETEQRIKDLSGKWLETEQRMEDLRGKCLETGQRMEDLSVKCQEDKEVSDRIKQENEDLKKRLQKEKENGARLKRENEDLNKTIIILSVALAVVGVLACVGPVVEYNFHLLEKSHSKIKVLLRRETQPLELGIIPNNNANGDTRINMEQPPAHREDPRHGCVNVTPPAQECVAAVASSSNNAGQAPCPSTEARRRKTLSPDTGANRIATLSPDTGANRMATLSPDTEANRMATLSPDTEANRMATLSPDIEATRMATLSPDTEANRMATLSPDTEATRMATLSPDTVNTVRVHQRSSSVTAEDDNDPGEEDAFALHAYEDEPNSNEQDSDPLQTNLTLAKNDDLAEVGERKELMSG